MDSSNHDPGPLHGLEPLGLLLEERLDSPSDSVDGVLLQRMVLPLVSEPVELPVTLMSLPPDRVEESPMSDFGVVLPAGPPEHVEDVVLPALAGKAGHFDAGLSSFGKAFDFTSSSQITEINDLQLKNVSNVNNCLESNKSYIYKTADPNLALLVLPERQTTSRDFPSTDLHMIPSTIDCSDKELTTLNQPAGDQLSSVNNIDRVTHVQEKALQESTAEQIPHSYSQVTSRLLSDQATVGPQPSVVTKECAVLIERLQNSNLDTYCRAIERQIGPNNIIFLGRAPGDLDKILVFLENHRLAEKLVRVGVNIRGRWLMVSFLSLPATRVVLSDVFPFIEDEVLIKALLPYGTVATPKMRKIRAATKNPSYRNIFSYRREIYIYIDQGKSLPATLDIDFQGEKYVVEVSTNGIKCFRCGKFGHSITFCDVPQSLGGVTEEKLVNISHKQSLNASSSDKITVGKLSLLPVKRGFARCDFESGVFEKENKELPNVNSVTGDAHVIDGGTQVSVSLPKDGSDHLGIIITNSEKDSQMKLESYNVHDAFSHKSIASDDLFWKEVIHSKKRKRKIFSSNEDKESSYLRGEETVKKGLVQSAFHSSDNRLPNTYAKEIPILIDDVQIQNKTDRVIYGNVPPIKPNVIKVDEVPITKNFGVGLPGLKTNETGCYESQPAQIAKMVQIEKDVDIDKFGVLPKLIPSGRRNGPKKRLKQLVSLESDQGISQKDDNSFITTNQKLNPYTKLFEREFSQPINMKEVSSSAFKSSINPATASQVTGNLLLEIKYKSEPVKVNILKGYNSRYPKLMDYLNTTLNHDKNTFIYGNHMHKKLTEVIGDLKRIIDPPTWDMRVTTQKKK